MLKNCNRISNGAFHIGPQFYNQTAYQRSSLITESQAFDKSWHN